MVKNVVSSGDYKGFSINENIQFDILQFADGTIMLSNDHWDNLSSLKGILRGFKMVYRLNVNLSKTITFGINLKEDVLSATATFLSCDVGVYCEIW